MDTWLRKLKDSYKGQKIKDGKTIGEKGRLTDEKIDRITTYYGNSIRANKNDLANLRRAIWAIFYHMRSTDSDPTHQFCKVSWCKYRRANDKSKFQHKNSIPLLEGKAETRGNEVVVKQRIEGKEKRGMIIDVIRLEEDSKHMQKAVQQFQHGHWIKYKLEKRIAEMFYMEQLRISFLIRAVPNILPSNANMRTKQVQDSDGASKRREKRFYGKRRTCTGGDGQPPKRN
ncbi:otu domain-containing protein 1 [Plakobranchus ocellatus]|uniref:Otu domain-containing protein 1 n=1 Tax=Plakobranchus ocellatus TaxID=259542 RepID=A0AAV4CCZ1_9GAST|nr:otu domain-containing protein 1 [Plakobranchus ocellatus]